MKNRIFQIYNALPYGIDYVYKDVIIEDNVWIGSNCSIAPGDRIGEGCIIGRSSVVFEEIPSNTIAIGNPAKVVKERDVKPYKFLKDNGYFLNDLRGKEYLPEHMRVKTTKNISNLLSFKGKVYDYELYKTPNEVSKTTYNFCLKNNAKFKCDNAGFFLLKRSYEKSIFDLLLYL